MGKLGTSPKENRRDIQGAQYLYSFENTELS
jgi:hypothetical protein